MNNSSNILLIISDPIQNNYLKMVIQNFGFNVHAVKECEEGFKIVREVKPALVIVDSNIQGIKWSDIVSKIKEINRNTTIFLLTSLTGKDETFNPDIDGLIVTPINYSELQNKITRLLNKNNSDNLSALTTTTIGEDSDAFYIDNLIHGKSKRIMEVKKIIRRVAEPEVTVLLRGESGTGKELAAQALCRFSKRRSKPFVKVLCAAIPETLLESELFGYEKGSFTGAHRSKPGKFEFANGGTIFLDEIGDVPQSLQVKLLQVLQDGEFSKIGGKEVKVDVRIITATNKNLERSVAAGTYREDLFYRLNVVSITMPSLRERKEDIPVLTEFFLRKYCQIYNKDYRPLSQETMDRFIGYDWPGNVRELENIVKRIIVLGSEKIELSGHTLESSTLMSSSAEKVKEVSDIKFKPCNLRKIAQDAVRKTEEEIIKNALIACKWNKRKTAEILSISYKTLFYKMRQYNLLE